MGNLPENDIGIGIVENLLGEVGAENDHCISCNTCRIECPVNIATSHLQPRKAVRMVNLGLLDELIRMPEIWYCLQCNKCNRICPMDVKPAVLIKHIRQEALKQKIMDGETFARYQELGVQLQRVRWHIVNHLMENKAISADSSEWSEWAKTQIPKPEQTIRINGSLKRSGKDQQPVFPTNLMACMTCRECTTTCPIAFEQSVYDPLFIFRMANLGQQHELIKFPAIWLCIECESCTSACRQMVRGHMIVRELKDLAMKENIVPNDFEIQVEIHNRAIYNRYRLEVDGLLGIKS